MDFIKVKIRNPNTPELLNSVGLNFKTVVSESTGEVSTKKVADLHYCNIVVYDSGLVMFMGSLHKMWNSINKIKAPNYSPEKTYTGYNGNDFPLTEIIKTQSYLCNILLCKPEQMEYQNIEFGINAQINFNPQLFIKGLLYHSGKLFEYKYKDHFAQAVHQRYFLKIYNKSNQYGMTTNTLRFETKIIKSEDLKYLGVKTFEDINANTLNNAHKLLLQRLDEVINYDYTITKEDLTERDINTLQLYSNPRYWAYEISKQNRTYHKKRLNELIAKYSNNIKSQLKASIIKKSNVINSKLKASKRGRINRNPELLNECKFHVIKDNDSSIKFLPINRDYELLNECKFLPINRDSETTKFLPINRSSILLISKNTTPSNTPFVAAPKQTIKPSKNDDPKTSTIPPQKKEVKNPKKETPKSEVFCRVTGLDISMQRAGSILLSHTGLKYHHSTNKKEFDKVLNKYLSKRWVHANFDKQIKEIAHNIRNKYTGCRTRNNNNYLENNLFRIAN